MRIVISWLGVLRRIGQKAGPYLMLEMLLPGGTLLALLLFLYRRREPDIAGAQSAQSSARCVRWQVASRNAF